MRISLCLMFYYHYAKGAAFNLQVCPQNEDILHQRFHISANADGMHSDSQLIYIPF